MSFRALVVASVAALAMGASAHASTFAFENSMNATLPLSITSGGVTATFSSVAGNGYQVQNTAGLLSFNTGLLDNNFFGTDPLTVTFSTPVSGTIVVPFAILDSFAAATDYLILTANTGQSLTVAGVPDSLVLAEPEGVAQFTLNAPITSLTLSGSNQNAALAFGDISTVATTATPEPTSLMLLATGVAGMALRRFRRS